MADEKTFTHPLRLDWMARYMRPPSCILDYGCGYGRTIEELAQAGYQNIIGADFSDGMLSRCRAKFPHLSLIRNDGQAFPFKDDSLDAILLFTVLTCLPRNDSQRTLMAEAARTLRGGGLLYISDLLLNDDARNQERYERCAQEYEAYGIFALPEGAIVRHHSREWINELTGSFSQLAYEPFEVITMNGNKSAAFQYLGRMR